MITALLALKKHLDTRSEPFRSDNTDSDSANFFMIGLVAIFCIISGYGAARLSYFYNKNIGNSGSAVMWSIVAFFFSDFYYPYYSYFLNPLSEKSSNNIKLN